MATTSIFLSASFLLALFIQGNCQCYPVTDLKVFQNKTGKQVGNKQQWKVTILNDCICSQLNIKISCNGFHNVEKNKASTVVEEDGVCQVNNKQPIFGFHTFNFTYAWDAMYPFHLLYSEISCS